MSKIKVFLVALLCTFTTFVYSQTYMHVQGHFNYWKHTEIFGPGIGFGFSHKFNKLNLSMNYDFGYGSINRYNSIENVNYDHWTTVFIKTEQGKWNRYLGFTGDLSNELKGSTDYGKQHQISLQIAYPIIQKDNLDIMFGIGSYVAIIEQFYTFTNVAINYIDLSPFYRGPLNYVPSTTQKIYTYGVNFELSANKSFGNKVISPFLIVGLGPKYGSYLSAGVRMSTLLLTH